MKIIEMVYENLEEVTALGAQLGYPFPLDEIQKRFVEISKSSSHKLFIAEDAGQVVGWIQVNKESASLWG